MSWPGFMQDASTLRNFQPDQESKLTATQPQNKNLQKGRTMKALMTLSDGVDGAFSWSVQL